MVSPLLVAAALLVGGAGHKPVALPEITVPRPPIVLATLSHSEAWRLDGRRMTCLVEIDSRSSEHDGHTIVECTSGNDVTRTIWFAEDRKLDSGKPIRVKETAMPKA